MEKTRLTTFGAERVPAGISFVERKRVFDQPFRVVGTQNRITQPVRCHRNTFLPDSERSLPKRMVQTGLLSGVLFGLSGVATVKAEEGVFGNFRLGVIHVEDETGNETDGSAIGGKLGYISPTWKGLSTGATFYTTGELFDDENGDFFSSENASYAILGEAYIQAEYSNTALRVGRFELDTPHADTDVFAWCRIPFRGCY